MSLSGIPAIITFDEACQRIAELETKKAELEAENQWLREQLRLQNHRQFGPSREMTPPGQESLDLFNEAEVLADTTETEATQVTHTPSKQTRTREQSFDRLPQETISYELPQEEQVCPCCGGPLHEIGKETTRKLKVVPAQFIAVNHIQTKYSCRACARDPETKTPVIEAPMPMSAFPGSLASPSLVSYIVCQKYLEGLPLYRQEQAFKRTGIDLSRQTMANWVIAASRVLQPIFDRLKHLLLRHDILHADETTLQVLQESGRAAQTSSCMWLYRTGRYPAKGPIVLYEYQQTRAGEHARQFLGDFRGFLLTDGHSGYDKMSVGVTNAGCWAHARRYFAEALAALPKGSIAVKGAKPTLAHAGLDFCNKLFAIERDLHDLPPEERRVARLTRSSALLERFRIWLDANVDKVTPKSLTGKAITYCRNQWPKLVAFLQEGRLEIDNNRSERSIKPFVIGRKNWLFSNTPRGARASATIYSIVETAKENGLNPFHYLIYLFENLPPSGTYQIMDSEWTESLLPWADSLPDACRVPAKAKSP